MSLNKSQVTKLVVDLCWEYDRMSSSGQETLDKLCKVLGIETEAEMDEFVNTLSSEQFKRLQVFFDTMPKLQKDIESKCSKCGSTHKRVLEGMADFFV